MDAQLSGGSDDLGDIVGGGSHHRAHLLYFAIEFCELFFSCADGSAHVGEGFVVRDKRLDGGGGSAYDGRREIAQHHPAGTLHGAAQGNTFL